MSREGQNKKEINHVTQKSLAHLHQSILVEECATDDDLREGIGGLFEECDDAPKKMINRLCIRDTEPIEQLL